MKREYTTREARNNMAEIINSAGFGKERIILTRRGKGLVAVVPIDDLEYLERLEDLADLQAAEVALADQTNEKRVPWEEVKKALKL
jgi:prevent-host-death family protein